MQVYVYLPFQHTTVNCTLQTNPGGVPFLRDVKHTACKHQNKLGNINAHFLCVMYFTGNSFVWSTFPTGTTYAVHKPTNKTNL